MENYGRLNAETGLSSRLEDFLGSFDQVVDYAIKNKVDLVLFCGDAYKSREPTQTQQREFARRVNRLATSGIPVFLLIGNHDLPNAIGRATTIEIFDTLAIKNVYVANRPEVHRIKTSSGPIQIVSLPWLRRSTLLSREETKNLTFEQINQKLQHILTKIITTRIPQLDPKLPAILAAHVWVSGAKVGSESAMTIGQEHVLLVSNIAQPAFDYIALGHIHQHQILADNPPVVYAGSLAQIDFGEEGDDKGFCLVEINEKEDRRQVSLAFHPVSGRRFVTINVNIESADPDPTLTVLQAISREKVKDAIVRLQLSLPTELEGQLRDNDLRDALKEAHYSSIAKEINRETRLRLGDFSAEEITPLDALQKYLESKKVSPERTRILLDYAEKLIEGQGTGDEK